MHSACLVKLPRFTRNELIILVAIGVITPLIDDRVEHFLVTFFLNISGSVNVFDYTGGPLNSDLLIVWEEYGAVLAAFLVRKPGAATLAMTINGFGQFFKDGYVGPHHLLYGVSGVGADLVFWAFRYRRYDAVASALAGVAAQFFWVPFSYVYHVVYIYPLSFIGGDLLIRLIGGALGDGLLGAGLGVAILQVGSWAGLQIGSPGIPEIPPHRPDALEHRLASSESWRTSQREQPWILLYLQDGAHFGIFRTSSLSVTQISQERLSLRSRAPSLPLGTTRILLNRGCRSILDCSSTLQMFFARSLFVLGLVSHSTRAYSSLLSVWAIPSRSGR
jgi:energy-coupling factor transport system permease protein